MMKLQPFAEKEKQILLALNKTLLYAMRHSQYYTSHSLKAPLSSLEQFEQLPLTEQSALSRGMEPFLCVSPEELRRVVTLSTSGSTGPKKRIGFSDSDLETTIHYFASGMGQLIHKTQTALICMPGGERPYGVVQLLSEALRRMGCKTVVYGAIQDVADAAHCICRVHPDCLIGIPTQILALASHCVQEHITVQMKCVLLSSDYMATGLRQRIESAFGCRVYNHYGSTEMGYGGALEDSYSPGLIPRERDLYFEIVDPTTGRHVLDGTDGEIIFTTLTRFSMPLIRYRTGDFAHFLPGSSRRMSPPYRRIGCEAVMSGKHFFLQSLDELLFTDTLVTDFSATVITEHLPRLCLRIWGGIVNEAALMERLHEFLPDGTAVEISFARPSEPAPGLLGKHLFRFK